MTTRHLLALFDSVYVLAMALLVGGIVFFSFVVAPIIFRVLGAEAGARFVRPCSPGITSGMPSWLPSRCRPSSPVP